jgi:hypothetical protein
MTVRTLDGLMPLYFFLKKKHTGNGQSLNISVATYEQAAAAGFIPTHELGEKYCLPFSS